MGNTIKILSNLEQQNSEFSGGLLKYDQDYSTQITPRSIPDAAWITGNTGSGPAGNNYEIQFNSGGTFGASSQLTYDYTSNLLTIDGTFNTSGNIEITNTGWGIFPNRVGVGTVPNLTGDEFQVDGSIAFSNSLKSMDSGGTVSNVWYTSGAEDINIIRNFNNIATLWTLRSCAGDPIADDREATLALVRTDDSGNEEFLDLYNNGYHSSNAVNYGIRIQKRGTGQYRPFKFEFDDGVTKTEVIDVDYSSGITISNSDVIINDNLTVNGTINGGGASASAANGLSTCGENIVLGGSLTGDTTIDGSSNDIYFTDNSSFNVTTPNIIFLSGGTSTLIGNTQTDIGIDDNVGSENTIVFSQNCALVTDSFNSEGLVYAADYSSVGSSNSRWIPDAAWVTGNTLTSGDNISELTNNCNYVKSGDNISELTNNCNYANSLSDLGITATATEINTVADGSTAKNDHTHSSGDLPSTLIYNGDNISELTNNCGYVKSGADISTFNNDCGYVKSNNYICDILGDGNGTITICRTGLGTFTHNLSHSHGSSDLPGTIMYEGENIGLLNNNCGYIKSVPCSCITQYNYSYSDLGLAAPEYTSAIAAEALSSTDVDNLKNSKLADGTTPWTANNYYDDGDARDAIEAGNLTQIDGVNNHRIRFNSSSNWMEFTDQSNNRTCIVTEDTYINETGTWVSDHMNNSSIHEPNTNYYLTAANFDTGNGVLSLTVNGTSNVSEDLDGRYLIGTASVSVSNDTIVKRDGDGDMCGRIVYSTVCHYNGSSTGYRFKAPNACGCAVDWVATSDCRLKDKIEPVTDALSKVDSLCGVCYNFCLNDTPDIGLLAQDVEKIEPRLVTRSEPDKLHKEKFGITDETLGLKYDKFSGLFVEAIKELKQKDIEQQKQIDNLQKQINELKELINK